MKYIILILTLTLIYTSGSNSQEKWSQTRKPVMGSYSKLPDYSNSWENSNRTVQTYTYDNSAVTVGPNIRVLPTSNAQQDEIVLVRHPTNHNIMLGGANTTVSNTYGQGAYITTDGGISWYGNNLISPFSQSSSDPGPTIDKDGVFIFTTLDPYMAAAYSTNNGVSWSSKVLLTNSSSDKNFAASDDVPSSPFYGRSYCVWSNFAVGSPPIVIAHTTNSGVSWSPVRQINTSVSGHYSQGCDIAIGPNGEVYVIWAAPMSSSPYTEDFLGFAKSTDGGITWNVSNNAYDMNGIRSASYNGWGLRINGFPRISVDRSGGARNGWIYVVAGEYNLAPAGSDADVIVHASSDGGATWSAGIRANQDPVNNGKKQFFPAIRVDEQGGVNIVYYDNRNYPSVGDSAETFLSRSTDGGATWIDIAVSDHRWKVKPEAGLGTYGGDYIGITSGNNKIWPFWFDDKTGTMQAWTCEVSFSTVGIGGNNGLPSKFELKQNYPNPFNPNTSINFTVPDKGNVLLEVYDVTGRKTATLINEVKQAGNYNIEFNASGYSSGIYFYTLKTEGFIGTRKMILVK